MNELFILGAGASYGSSFLDQEKTPIINNFFTKAFPIVGNRYDFFFKYLETEFGLTKTTLESGNINFEELYSYIDANARFDASGQPSVNYHEFKIFHPLHYFEALIYETILFYNFQSKDKTCKYHDKLAKYTLENKSYIISLNYDCIIDRSLLNQKKWHEEGGYGIYDSLILFDDDKPISPPILLKIHGSLNWLWGDDNLAEIHIIKLNEFFSRFRHHPTVQLLKTFTKENLLEEFDGDYFKNPRQGDPVVIFPSQFKDFKIMNSLSNKFNIYLSMYFKKIDKITIIGAHLLNDIHIISWLTKFMKTANKMFEIELVNPMTDANFEVWIEKAKIYLPNAKKIYREFLTFSDFANSKL